MSIENILSHPDWRLSSEAFSPFTSVNERNIQTCLLQSQNSISPVKKKASAQNYVEEQKQQLANRKSNETMFPHFFKSARNSQPSIPLTSILSLRTPPLEKEESFKQCLKKKNSKTFKIHEMITVESIINSKLLTPLNSSRRNENQNKETQNDTINSPSSAIKYKLTDKVPSKPLLRQIFSKDTYDFYQSDLQNKETSSKNEWEQTTSKSYQTIQSPQHIYASRKDSKKFKEDEFQNVKEDVYKNFINQENLLNPGSTQNQTLAYLDSQEQIMSKSHKAKIQDILQQKETQIKPFFNFSTREISSFSHLGSNSLTTAGTSSFQIKFHTLNGEVTPQMTQQVPTEKSKANISSRFLSSQEIYPTVGNQSQQSKSQQRINNNNRKIVTQTNDKGNLKVSCNPSKSSAMIVKLLNNERVRDNSLIRNYESSTKMNSEPSESVKILSIASSIRKDQIKKKFMKREQEIENRKSQQQIEKRDSGTQQGETFCDYNNDLSKLPHLLLKHQEIDHKTQILPEFMQKQQSNLRNTFIIGQNNYLNNQQLASNNQSQNIKDNQENTKSKLKNQTIFSSSSKKGYLCLQKPVIFNCKSLKDIKQNSKDLSTTQDQSYNMYPSRLQSPLFESNYTQEQAKKQVLKQSNEQQQQVQQQIKSTSCQKIQYQQQDNQSQRNQRPSTASKFPKTYNQKIHLLYLEKLKNPTPLATLNAYLSTHIQQFDAKDSIGSFKSWDNLEGEENDQMN